MTKLQLAFIYALSFAGVTLALWPAGQAASGWWQQRELRLQWDKAVAQAQQEARTENGPPPADSAPVPTAPPRGVRQLQPRTVAYHLGHHGAPAACQHLVRPVPATAAVHKPAKPHHWTPTRLIIPDIGLDTFVVQGVGPSSLRQGPGHDPYSALPGQWGTCVIAGHRNCYGWWFYKLGQLGSDSEIELRTPRASYTYQVAQTVVVQDKDTRFLQAPQRTDAAPRLALYTCTLPHSDSRIVVVARLVHQDPA